MLTEFELARQKQLTKYLLDLTISGAEDYEGEELLSCPTCGSYDFNLKIGEIICSICGEGVDPNSCVDEE
jgi:hypothetical protein